MTVLYLTRPVSISWMHFILSDIENSIGLAIDTGVKDIVVTGDLNLNMLNQHSRMKITDLCQTYNLTQLINDPTHYTETSFSIIDLVLVSNSHSVELSGVSQSFLSQDLPWINGTIRKLMRKRNRHYKKYKLNKTVENYESFKDIRNNVTSSLRKSKKEYFKSFADKLKSSSLVTSDYWKTLKSFIKPSVDTSIPHIFHNGSYISDSSDKAKLLNDFFVSQTSLDNSTATLQNTDSPANNTLHNIKITVEEVQSVLQTLKLGRNLLDLIILIIEF